MSALSARFFEYVQGADFYRDLHRDAVHLLPQGDGKTWFDVGCGPGLVARLAHDHGYAAVGFDVDRHMIRRARLRASDAAVRFVQSGLAELVADHGQADVVSAASLLRVLPDRATAVSLLLDAVAPRGTLLIVETSERMGSLPESAPGVGAPVGRRAWVLQLWAHSRRTRPAVNVEQLVPPGYSARRYDLLRGLVDAWVVRRSADGCFDQPVQACKIGEADSIRPSIAEKS